MMVWFISRAVAQNPDAQKTVDENVQLSSGPIIGNARDAAGVLSFKGIPFAAPPVGPLRWSEPRLVKPWPQPRSAKDYGAICWQTKADGFPRLTGNIDEDCLFLNVWTAARSNKERRPVMVWIHGGGFLFGTASRDATDGSLLAQEGVVVVTLNYRVGVFGYLAHSLLNSESGGHASGMYGILDQIAALHWVRDNIASFGGDPGNVTIFGVSAGSHAVSILMASPLAKGLFNKAIGESGAFWASESGGIRRMTEAEKMGGELQKKLGAQSLNDMRAVSAADLQAATPWSADTDPGVTSYGPIMDGYVLPDDPVQIFAQGRQSDVPMIAGWNANENGAFRGRSLPHKDASSFVTAATAKFGPRHIDELVKHYPAGNDQEVTASAWRLVGDEVIAFWTWLWVDLQSKTGRSPSYVYNFGLVSDYTPDPNHATEVPYVFGNFPTKGSINADRRDFELSEIFRRYWTNFAKTGNPNGPNLPKWSSYSPNPRTVLELAGEVREIPDRATGRFNFLRSFWVGDQKRVQ
jgi:para-nitrobenzyl esterase